MVREDRVVMRESELRRVHVIRQVLARQLTHQQAAEALGLTPRHIRRLRDRLRAKGDQGLAHRGRGKPSNRQKPTAFQRQVLALYARHYSDFGPTLAVEQLATHHGLRLSEETLRRWLRAAGIDHFRRRPRPHRTWRARRAHRGELVQLDGSHHEWLEGRGPRCVLMAYIDDASSRVFARFYEYEGTMPALDSFQRYVKQYGIPLAVYADKHTTYRSPAEPTVEEQLTGVAPMSQFGRALRELGVELIPAHSPQAKGRIERLFHTLQDRLVKEMRVAGIATLADANRFLPAWLAQYNRRFTVHPAHATDLHRPLAAGTDVRAVLALKTRRVLRRDRTVAHGGQLYQILDRVRATQVVVEERVDGTLRMRHQNRPLTYQPILHRPRPVVPPRPARRPRPLGEAAGYASLESVRHLRPCQAPRGHSMNRTFLLWQEADISKVGGQGSIPSLTPSAPFVSLNPRRVATDSVRKDEVCSI
jgi:transposase